MDVECVVRDGDPLGPGPVPQEPDAAAADLDQRAGLDRGRVEHAAGAARPGGVRRRGKQREAAARDAEVEMADHRRFDGDQALALAHRRLGPLLELDRAPEAVDARRQHAQDRPRRDIDAV